MGALRGTIYKAFLPIQGMSLIARHLTRLTASGVRRVSVVTDLPDPLISAYLREARDGLKIDLDIVHVRGDADRKILHVVGRGHPPSPIFVGYGDSYSWYDPWLLRDAALTHGMDSALAVCAYRIPYGVISTEANRVVSFDEKPATDYLISAGQMVLGHEAFALLRRGLGVAATLSELASRGRLAAVEVSAGMLGVDSLNDIIQAHDADVLNQ